MLFTIRIAWELIFVSKNCPNDVKVGCKDPSTLIKLIDSKIDLEEELDEFDGSFNEKNWMMIKF